MHRYPGVENITLTIQSTKEAVILINFYYTTTLTTGKCNMYHKLDMYVKVKMSQYKSQVF